MANSVRCCQIILLIHPNCMYDHPSFLHWSYTLTHVCTPFTPSLLIHLNCMYVCPPFIPSLFIHLNSCLYTLYSFIDNWWVDVKLMVNFVQQTSFKTIDTAKGLRTVIVEKKMPLFPCFGWVDHMLSLMDEKWVGCAVNGCSPVVELWFAVDRPWIQNPLSPFFSCSHPDNYRCKERAAKKGCR